MPSRPEAFWMRVILFNPVRHPCDLKPWPCAQPPVGRSRACFRQVRRSAWGRSPSAAGACFSLPCCFGRWPWRVVAGAAWMSRAFGCWPGRAHRHLHWRLGLVCLHEPAGVASLGCVFRHPCAVLRWPGSFWGSRSGAGSRGQRPAQRWSVGATTTAAKGRPEQGQPPRGAATRAAVERGGDNDRSEGPPRARSAPSGGSDPRSGGAWGPTIHRLRCTSRLRRASSG